MEIPIQDNTPEPDNNATDCITNETLLAQLAQTVKARRRMRLVLKTLYGGSTFIYFATTLYFFCTVHTWGDWFMPVYLLYLSAIAVFYLLNSAFYKRTLPALRETLLSLAERGEERAVGPLLDLMDARLSSMGGWGRDRILLFQAMSTLLSHLTPESFQRLSDAQVHQLTPLLLFHEPELNSATSTMFARCGDARALRALKRFQKMFTFRRLMKWYPGVTMSLKLMRRFNKPALDADAMDGIDACCVAIEARLNAESGSVQLLRASDGASATPEQLLRAASSTDESVVPNELVRAVEQTPVERRASRTTVGNPIETTIEKPLPNVNLLS